MVATPKSRQVDTVLARQVLLQCWVYGGWAGPKQGVGLGVIEVSLGVLRVDVGTERGAVRKGG